MPIVILFSQKNLWKSFSYLKASSYCIQFILGLFVQEQNSNFCYDSGAFLEKTSELNRRQNKVTVIIYLQWAFKNESDLRMEW